ncbi:nitrate- and nitrite sensing domain-containing protein [Yinghuangia aomiensis]
MWSTYTLDRYRQARDLHQTLSDVQRVAVKGELAMVALQEERRLSMAFLAGSGTDRARLDRQREATDQALGVMSQAAGPVVGHQAPELKAIFARISTGLAALPRVPAAGGRPAAHVRWRVPVLHRGPGHRDELFRSPGAGPPTTPTRRRKAPRPRPRSRALEYFAQQNAVLTAAVASPGGPSTAQRAQFDQLVGAQRAQYAFVRPQLRDAQAAQFTQIVGSPEFAVLVSVEDSVSARTGKLAVDPAWQPAMLEHRREASGTHADPGGVRAGVRQWSGWTSRPTSVIVRRRRDPGADPPRGVRPRPGVTGLDPAARTACATRPGSSRTSSCRMSWHGSSAARRSTRTTPRPTSTTATTRSAKWPPRSTRLHRTAVQAAIEQAETRQGISRVFLNLAHRSQGLVHRQLALLDKLEREHEDPDLLAELFQADHLATRMRRNAENLSVLGGTMPASALAPIGAGSPRSCRARLRRPRTTPGSS